MATADDDDDDDDDDAHDDDVVFPGQTTTMISLPRKAPISNTT